MKTDVSDHEFALMESEPQPHEKPRKVTREVYGKKHAAVNSGYSIHGQERSKMSLQLKEKALERARSVWALRRERDAMFQKSSYPPLFGEPIWDMLLDLYISELQGRKISVSSLCIAANVPQTTALRYLSEMLDARLVVRVDDPKDLRRSFVELSNDGFRLLTKVLIDL